MDDAYAADAAGAITHDLDPDTTVVCDQCGRLKRIAFEERLNAGAWPFCCGAAMRVTFTGVQPYHIIVRQVQGAHS